MYPAVYRMYDRLVPTNVKEVFWRVRDARNRRRRQGLVGAVPIEYRFRKLQIILTSRCDLTCVMCSIIHEGKAALREETVRQLIDDADQLGFNEIEITGGEPYHRPYFKSVVEDYAGRIKPKLRICTNAHSLDRALIDKLDGRKRLHFQVSFDGTTDVHNWIRVQNRYDAFSKSEENFRLLAAARLTVSLNTVIQRHNVGNLLATYRHFKDVPYRYHAFNIVEEGSWDYENNRLRPEQIDDLVSELNQIVTAARSDAKVILGLGPNVIEHIRSMKDSGPKTNSEPEQISTELPLHAGYGCTVPFAIVIVGPQGHVYPCFHYYPSMGRDRHNWYELYRSEFSIKDRRLMDVLLSPEYIERSRRMGRIDGCEGCTTTCYSADEIFRRKCMHPTEDDIKQRDAQREFLRQLRSKVAPVAAE